jgi:hypothetical protein
VAHNSQFYLLLSTTLGDVSNTQVQISKMKHLNVNTAVVKQVCEILESNGHSLYNVSNLYFTTVHKWFPIIARDRFYKRLGQLKTNPNAEFATVVLSVYLITRTPCRHQDGSSMQSPLYLTAKRLLSLLQWNGKRNLEILQSSLLIAVYECAHGSSETAYLTIGACIRHGQALMLYNPHSLVDGAKPDSRRVEECCLWWGTFIFETYALRD